MNMRMMENERVIGQRLCQCNKLLNIRFDLQLFPLTTKPTTGFNSRQPEVRGATIASCVMSVLYDNVEY